MYSFPSLIVIHLPGKLLNDLFLLLKALAFFLFFNIPLNIAAAEFQYFCLFQTDKGTFFWTALSTPLDIKKSIIGLISSLCCEYNVFLIYILLIVLSEW